MYQVNCKVRRKDGGKPLSEVYLVEAVSITDVDVKINTEFKDLQVEISLCKSISIVQLFETGEGTFFTIKVASEDLDGKVTKEVFIQEAENYYAAEKYFKGNITYGEITDINITNIMGVLR